MRGQNRGHWTTGAVLASLLAGCGGSAEDTGPRPNWTKDGGVAVQMPDLEFRPAGHSFSDVPLGTTARVELSVRNRSPFAVRIETPTPAEDSPDADAFEFILESPTISGGAQTTVEVRFTPTEDRFYQVEFRVPYASSDRSFTERMVFEGAGDTSDLQVSPLRLDFGQLRVGMTATLPILVFNRGWSTETIRVTQIRACETEPADIFCIQAINSDVAEGLTFQVAAGQTVSVDITYRPSDFPPSTDALGFRLYYGQSYERVLLGGRVIE